MPRSERLLEAGTGSPALCWIMLRATRWFGSQWWLGVVLMLVCSGTARAATCPDGGNSVLPAGSGEDLEVVGACSVGAGTYHYGNVNVYGGGVLTFADAVVDFWTSGIVIENEGSVVAGVPEPIGTNGGRLTIHLYGADQGAQPFGVNDQGGQGIVCKSPGGLCGIPSTVWDTNGSSVQTLPGGVEDYFYQYHPLPYDDGGMVKGYFGYKSIGVGYGGTLQLFGKQGATYTALEPTDSGTSWVRLGATAPKDAPTITLAKPVDWAPESEIVITTTDYIPGHSEQRKIASISPDGLTITLDRPLEHAHNGERYPLKNLPERLGIDFDSAETRAAVALLTRSIRIVSAGDAYDDPFAAEAPGKYFGGHTIARAGFAKFQMQGVEMYQLGQGGRLGHYPVHFHMARKAPADTFVRDCSVHDSMTRFYVVHATHGVTLERNVGYKSIGHGYYIEDGTEIDNEFHANIGILARAAIDNVQNPRRVPGILASPDGGGEYVPYHSDWDHPSVFWIMNGWNEFVGNMAVGATSCGACYWLVPGANSGGSRNQTWDSYAAMQANLDRAATTPLKRFEGNYCSTAMNSFNVVGNTAVCHGINEGADSIPAVTNTLAPASKSDAGKDYYPIVDAGGGRFATLCKDGQDCATIPKCANGAQANCAVTVLDRYTSAFNWTETNFAAIWLRPQWYLVVNSIIADVQNGGLTFITGGDYTESSTIGGHWALARKNVFIGETRPGDPFAGAGGPFNTHGGLACDTNSGNNCLSRAEGVAFPISNFGTGQRLFNIYDGPAYQESNAYLAIKKTPLTGCDLMNGNCPQGDYPAYGRTLGIPRHGDACYLPNAAIGWKQPNGFYYPPAFRSRNLFFDDVDIRHFVVEPSFLPGTFTTDQTAIVDRYCTRGSAMFTGFTDVDRQTVLNDDDGSLTGLVGTTTVNEDSFFAAPVETIQCKSDMTSRTTPYAYVSTVVYPKCAADGTCTSTWDRECSNQTCYGVPLYRQYLTKAEQKAKKLDDRTRSILLMGESIWQRNSLTVNNGLYYIDTTVSQQQQSQVAGINKFTVFEPGQTYNVFFLYGQPTTRQTYQMYVGIDPAWKAEEKVSAVGVTVASSPLKLGAATWPAGWTRDYDPKTGLLTVTVDLAAYAQAFTDARQKKCQPPSFCTWKNDRCQCSLSEGDPNYAECIADDSAVCAWAGRDLDCPEGGCPGFAVTLSSTFATNPAKDPRPKAVPFPDGKDPDAAKWNVAWDLAGPIAGDCSSPITNALIGTPGNDKLVGTKDSDLLVGGGGRDRIYGRGGDDEIHGKGGDDLLVGGPGNDTLYGGAGDDVLKGGKGDNVIHGGPGIDRVVGGGNNTCTGTEKGKGCK